MAVAVALGAALAAVSASPVPARAALVPPAGPPTLGAWVWTRADARLLARARASNPALRAAVHVATIERHPDGQLASHLALSPDAAWGADREVAVVVRFDESLNAGWDPGSEAAVAEGIAPLLARTLAQIEATGARAPEVQLDYDAPVRALGAWAGVVARLTAGPLHDCEVWVTSIPAHLDVAAYGAMFGRAGVGHILQVFDTGLTCTPEHASHLTARLAAAGLRFRVGVGGFERSARPGEHACWTAQAASWRALPGYAGAGSSPPNATFAARSHPSRPHEARLFTPAVLAALVARAPVAPACGGPSYGDLRAIQAPAATLEMLLTAGGDADSWATWQIPEMRFLYPMWKAHPAELDALYGFAYEQLADLPPPSTAKLDAALAATDMIHAEAEARGVVDAIYAMPPVLAAKHAAILARAVAVLEQRVGGSDPHAASRGFDALRITCGRASPTAGRAPRSSSPRSRGGRSTPRRTRG